MESVRGVIHGKHIELDNELGLPDGQTVAVVVRPLAGELRSMPSTQGILRSAGAWAEDADELDKYLEWNRHQRKISRVEIEP